MTKKKNKTLKLAVMIVFGIFLFSTLLGSILLVINYKPESKSEVEKVSIEQNIDNEEDKNETEEIEEVTEEVKVDKKEKEEVKVNAEKSYSESIKDLNEDYEEIIGNIDSLL